MGIKGKVVMLILLLIVILQCALLLLLKQPIITPPYNCIIPVQNNTPGMPTYSCSATANNTSRFSNETIEQARQVALQARPSIVVISSGPGETATGWFIDRGILVTNRHVVEGRHTVSATALNGDNFTAEVVDTCCAEMHGGVSGYTGDIAILRTNYTNAPPLQTGSYSDVNSGDVLVQVGNSGGGLIGYWLITIGRVTDKQNDKFESDVPVMQGGSGSPVMTLDGRVVGMTSGSRPAIASNPFNIVPVPPDVRESLNIATVTSHESIDKIQERVAIIRAGR